MLIWCVRSGLGKGVHITRKISSLSFDRRRGSPWNPVDVICHVINRKFDVDEAESVRAFAVFSNYHDYPVVQIHYRGDKLFKKTPEIAEETGVYLHITGPPMPRVIVSEWFDQHCAKARESPTIHEKWDSSNLPAELFKVTQGMNAVSSLICVGGYNILLDVGFKALDDLERVLGDIGLKIKDIDLVVVTHAHSDHDGGMFDLYLSGHCNAPLLCTRSTFELAVQKDKYYSDLVKEWRDTGVSQNGQSGMNEPHREDLYKQLNENYTDILSHLHTIIYGDELHLSDDNLILSFLQAGHHPGAIMVQIGCQEHKIVYTGDFNLESYEPFASGRASISQLSHQPDVLICECAAAHLEFPKSQATKALLFSQIKQTVDRKGVVGLFSNYNVGPIVLYFIISEKLAKMSAVKTPFYFDSTSWDLLCILRDRKEDLSKKVQTLIDNHKDPFHSIMIRQLTRNMLTTGGLDCSQYLKGAIVSLGTDILKRPKTAEREWLSAFLGDEKNLAIVMGAPRKRQTLDLISGRPRLETMKGHISEFDVLCRILNLDLPSNHVFNYHPDRDQLLEMIDGVMPKQLILFHNAGPTLVDFRQHLGKREYLEDHRILYAQPNGIELW